MIINFLNIMFFFIIFSILDVIVVRFEIKNNIHLFYELHKSSVEKELSNDKE